VGIERHLKHLSKFEPAPFGGHYYFAQRSTDCTDCQEIGGYGCNMIENEKKRPQSNHRLPIGTKEQPQKRGKMHRLKGKSTKL
jgi:hypothetical protein